MPLGKTGIDRMRQIFLLELKRALRLLLSLKERKKETLKKITVQEQKKPKMWINQCDRKQKPVPVEIPWLWRIHPRGWFGLVQDSLTVASLVAVQLAQPVPCPFPSWHGAGSSCGDRQLCDSQSDPYWGKDALLYYPVTFLILFSLIQKPGCKTQPKCVASCTAGNIRGGM